MPKKPSKKDFTPHREEHNAPRCDVDGCVGKGLYKAPSGKDALHDYRWFCLDHIREHNEKWNFMEGMSREEIEAFTKDAMLGHRPTWNRETVLRGAHIKLEEALGRFMGRPVPKPRPASLPPKVVQAMATLDIDYPYTKRSLKLHYRALVKKHHPDANKGDKTAEERFKSIAVAYKLLMDYIEKP